MNVLGLDSILSEIAKKEFFVKVVLTNQSAIFFPGTLQHRDVKNHGVSYEDDYKGNAMAATITPGQIDVRFHQSYNDDQVRVIFQELLTIPKMEWASSFGIRYQGRTLISS